MATRSWTTSTVRPDYGLLYWQEAVCEALFELEVSSLADKPFHASLLQKTGGPLSMSRINVDSEQIVSRTRSAIARSLTSQFDLVWLMEGQGLLIHAGREIELKSGSCVLIDIRREFSFTTRGCSHVLSAHLPSHWLATRLASPEDFVARPVDADSLWGRTLIHGMQALAEGPHQFFAEEAGADLIANAFALAIGPNPKAVTRHGSRLYGRLLECLRASAGIEGFNAAALAEQIGISLRYLHALFASNGTTFGSELLEIKLGRAARLLRDPSFMTTSVAEIGRISGFCEPSHFSRRFRRRFDQTPAAYRKAGAS